LCGSLEDEKYLKKKRSGAIFLKLSNPTNLKVTLDEGSMKLSLVKSFKLVPRPLDKGPGPRQIKL
jgi:hypothetical protein